jgi:hypothetical protein
MNEGNRIRWSRVAPHPIRCVFVLAKRRPCVLCCKCNAFLQASKAIKSGTNVEGEDWGTVRLRRRGVVIYDITDFLAGFWTTNNPVMPVKWWFVAFERNMNIIERVGYANTHLNLHGSSHPASNQKRAFGDISPGRPLNLARYGFSPPLDGQYKRQTSPTAVSTVPVASPLPL